MFVEAKLEKILLGNYLWTIFCRFKDITKNHKTTKPLSINLVFTLIEA
jgi:hypothetical protein